MYLGDNTVVMDVRTTKFFDLKGEQKIGVFFELFNLFNTSNFGGSYTGNARSSNFRQADAKPGFVRVIPKVFSSFSASVRRSILSIAGAIVVQKVITPT